MIQSSVFWNGLATPKIANGEQFRLLCMAGKTSLEKEAPVPHCSGAIFNSSALPLPPKQDVVYAHIT